MADAFPITPERAPKYYAFVMLVSVTGRPVYVDINWPEDQRLPQIGETFEHEGKMYAVTARHNKDSGDVHVFCTFAPRPRGMLGSKAATYTKR